MASNTSPTKLLRIRSNLANKSFLSLSIHSAQQRDNSLLAGLAGQGRDHVSTRVFHFGTTQFAGTVQKNCAVRE